MIAKNFAYKTKVMVMVKEVWWIRNGDRISFLSTVIVKPLILTNLGGSFVVVWRK